MTIMKKMAPFVKTKSDYERFYLAYHEKVRRGQSSPARRDVALMSLGLNINRGAVRKVSRWQIVRMADCVATRCAATAVASWPQRSVDSEASMGRRARDQVQPRAWSLMSR